MRQLRSLGNHRQVRVNECFHLLQRKAFYSVATFARMHHRWGVHFNSSASLYSRMRTLSTQIQFILDEKYLQYCQHLDMGVIIAACSGIFHNRACDHRDCLYLKYVGESEL
jgi:hypothetical protein